jgi:hypothetical protein
MLQTASRLLPELPLFLMTAVATHLFMSFAQTLMHYKLGHHPMGGKFFRNHINFHHTYYSKDHLLSRAYLGDEGNKWACRCAASRRVAAHLPSAATRLLRRREG